MKLKSFATGLAALSLMASPTLASAAPAAAPQPAVEDGDGGGFLGGDGAIVAVLALLAIAAGIVAAASGSDKPTSP